MNTHHRIILQDARKLSGLDDNSIDLVVTSPPYPMIEMWDGLFSALHPAIGAALRRGDVRTSFELMHQVIDPVWRELYRVVKAGGFVCINIGDATRTVQGRFQLFGNHSRIQQKLFEIGFTVLPPVLWRKPTNAPNKFMGSGMLPAGAYVTLEHEYILIFRKGNNRMFRTDAEKLNRRQSALFWEERNTWYSDVWDLKGMKQEFAEQDLRERSAAYPFVLPFRLVNMYSVFGDTVLDPFLGTGTTTLAAIACGRNSVGCEIEADFARFFQKRLALELPSLNSCNLERIKNHIAFIEQFALEKRPPKYTNVHFNFPVITRQEVNLRLAFVDRVEATGENACRADYLEESAVKAAVPGRLDGEGIRTEGPRQLRMPV